MDLTAAEDRIASRSWILDSTPPLLKMCYRRICEYRAGIGERSMPLGMRRRRT